LEFRRNVRGKSEGVRHSYAGGEKLEKTLPEKESVNLEEHLLKAIYVKAVKEYLPKDELNFFFQLEN
jgi:hypothetical protein